MTDPARIKALAEGTPTGSATDISLLRQQLATSEQSRAQAEQALLTAVAPTTLIAAAHMLRACADQIERLAIGYGSEQMRAIAARLDDGAGVVRLSLGLTVPQATTTDETP